MILVWLGMSLLEYCLESLERSPSFFPPPPRAVSKVGRWAVVILAKAPFGDGWNQATSN